MANPGRQAWGRRKAGTTRGMGGVADDLATDTRAEVRFADRALYANQLTA